MAGKTKVDVEVARQLQMPFNVSCKRTVLMYSRKASVVNCQQFEQLEPLVGRAAQILRIAAQIFVGMSSGIGR